MAVAALDQSFGGGVLNIGSLFMVGVVKQHFVQASPIEDFATFSAPREVLFFFGWKLFVFVERHCIALDCPLRDRLHRLVRS